MCSILSTEGWRGRGLVRAIFMGDYLPARGEPVEPFERETMGVRIYLLCCYGEESIVNTGWRYLKPLFPLEN